MICLSSEVPAELPGVSAVTGGSGGPSKQLLSAEPHRRRSSSGAKWTAGRTTQRATDIQTRQC